MSDSLIRPADECPDRFEPLRTYKVSGVHNRHLDLWEDVEVTAGWTPGSGRVIRLGDHDYTPAEATDLIQQLLDALRLQLIASQSDSGPVIL